MATGGAPSDGKRFELEFLPAAARELEKLPSSARPIVIAAVVGLGADPRPDGAKLLSGTSSERIWRVAIADYRILYQVKDDVLVVLIVRVADRRDVYNSTTIRRLLKQLRSAR